jgi:hypothetical protein
MSTTFNPVDFMRNANEREAAAREGKTPELKPPAAEAKPPEAKPEGEPEAETESHRVSRSTRRLLRQLGEAEGRAKVLEELVLAGKSAPGKAPEAAEKKDEDPAPKQADYSDFDAYHADLTKWQARQEVGKQMAVQQELKALEERLAVVDKQAREDAKLLPDFQAVAQEAEKAVENGEAPVFDTGAPEHQQLVYLLETSDLKAFILYHLAKNPEEMEKALELSQKPQEQIRWFHRLEGALEREYRDLRAAKKSVDEKKPPASAAERDAKKPRPSESVAVHGGSAPAVQVSPVLEDGKTLNPAWKDRANEREGRRR